MSLLSYHMGPNSVLVAALEPSEHLHGNAAAAAPVCQQTSKKLCVNTLQNKRRKALTSARISKENRFFFA